MHLSVYTRKTRDAKPEFAMRAPLSVIVQLFHLREETVRRVEATIETEGSCELFCNNRSHGAWGSLRVFSVVLGK